MKSSKKDKEKLLKDSSKIIKKLLENHRINIAAWQAHHPPTPPNEKCHHAFIRGLSIENSFGPSVGDYVPLFGNEYETVYIWTHTLNKNSAIVVDVERSVKDQPSWRTIMSAVRLALRYIEAFENGLAAFDGLEYKWIYHFDSHKTSLDNATIYRTYEFDRQFIQDGRVVKASLFTDLSPYIELFLRDEKAYTAISLLNASFDFHSFCLLCALSKHPFRSHIAVEPEIWEHLEIVPKMEASIVFACRSIESILGQPPNRSKRRSIMRFKEKWIELIGIDPEDTFDLSETSHLDFYYHLFSTLRNPSAHSYGNIRYDIERIKTVQAQSFAARIVSNYIEKSAKDVEESMSVLNLNQELLSRVSRTMSTSLTLEGQRNRGLSYL